MDIYDSVYLKHAQIQLYFLHPTSVGVPLIKIDDIVEHKPYFQQIHHKHFTIKGQIDNKSCFYWHTNYKVTVNISTLQGPFFKWQHFPVSA